MTTSNDQAQQGTAPLWSDEDIHNDAKRASSNPTEQAKIRSCLLFMRNGYEYLLYLLRTDVAIREKHVAKLEVQLAEARTRLSGTEAAQEADDGATQNV